MQKNISIRITNAVSLNYEFFIEKEKFAFYYNKLWKDINRYEGE